MMDDKDNERMMREATAAVVRARLDKWTETVEQMSAQMIPEERLSPWASDWLALTMLFWEERHLPPEEQSPVLMREIAHKLREYDPEGYEAMRGNLSYMAERN